MYFNIESSTRLKILILIAGYERRWAEEPGVRSPWLTKTRTSTFRLTSTAYMSSPRSKFKVVSEMDRWGIQEKATQLVAHTIITWKRNQSLQTPLFSTRGSYCLISFPLDVALALARNLISINRFPPCSHKTCVLGTVAHLPNVPHQSSLRFAGDCVPNDVRSQPLFNDRTR